MKNKNIVFLVIAVAIALYGFWQKKLPDVQSQAPSSQNAHQINSAKSDQVLKQAYQQQQNKLQIQGSGIVSKTLPDDNKGSRHQRFIIKLASGQSLLVAHNIDLAPRLPGLKKGDSVNFYGQYEWSEQGGVIHWTHNDPKQRHNNGWLKYKGKLYQ